MNPNDPQSDHPGAAMLETAPPSRDFLALVPFDLAWRHRFCAVSIDDTRDLIIATEDTPPSAIARITEAMPRECHLAHASDDEVCRLIARAYQQSRSA